MTISKQQDSGSRKKIGYPNSKIRGPRDQRFKKHMLHQTQTLGELMFSQLGHGNQTETWRADKTSAVAKNHHAKGGMLRCRTKGQESRASKQTNKQTNKQTQPNPTQPNPTQPNPTQPNPTQPNPTQPNPKQTEANQLKKEIRCHISIHLLLVCFAAFSAAKAMLRHKAGSTSTQQLQI